MRPNKSFWVLAVVGICLVALLSSLVIIPEKAHAYIPHDPISINGNAEFTAANGVTGGDGSPGNPYLIEGWEISGNNGPYCLQIYNTDSHFIIRDVYLHHPEIMSATCVIFSGVSNGRIENSTIWQHGSGIGISLSDNITISESNISGAWHFGIFASFSTNIVIENSTLSNRMGDISILESSDVKILYNEVLESWSGIDSYRSENLEILGNDVIHNTDGIFLTYTNNSTIADNYASNYETDIFLHSSMNDKVLNNTMVEQGMAIFGTLLEHWNTHVIDISNEVNGGPVHYLKNVSSGSIPPNPGQVILANCSGVVVEGHTISLVYDAIELGFSQNNIIANNTFLQNGNGIYTFQSSENTISNNYAWDNGFGMLLYFSDDNVVVDNTALDSWNGIYIRDSRFNFVYSNTVSLNGDGIELLSSSNNTIDGNTVSMAGTGILLDDSEYNTISNNTIEGNSNGIEIYSRGNNLIFHNNLNGNTVQAFNEMSVHNKWDNGYPYGGNYWNDYWGSDNKSGPNQDQPGSDGIGDTPYYFDVNALDHYPLMGPLVFMPPHPPGNPKAELTGTGFSDITLSWDLSIDDTGGQLSVVRYDIFRSTNFSISDFDPSFSDSVPKGTSSYVDAGVGEGDSQNYYYLICAVDYNNNTSCSQTQAAKFTRPLIIGLNLLSTPLVQTNESIDAVLRTVDWDVAYYYDAKDLEWRSHSKAKPYPQGFEYIDHSMGVWVNVTGESNLTVAGTVPSQTIIQLYPEWNLVGFPNLNTSYMVYRMKLMSEIQYVEGFDPNMPPYFLRPLSDFEHLVPGYGYWVRVETESAWVVDVP